MDLSKRYQNLNRRRIDPSFATRVAVADALEKSEKKGPVPYILSAMQPVDVRSTNVLFDQANRLFNQLEKPAEEASLPIVQQLQGSVTNNTHIRYYSDIDLLTLISDSKFTTIKAPLEVSSPYHNGKSDLYSLRDLEGKVLKEKFPAAKVDSTKPKSIKVSGGSLKGPVDVVPCNWIDTKEWRETNNIVHRGIKILNAETGERIENYPFMHNHLLLSRDSLTHGGSNKLIRFLKTLIADSKYETVKIDISSYDVCGLVYNMSPSDLLVSPNGEINLIENFIKFADSLIDNQETAMKLMVPNKTRGLFGKDGLSFSELRLLNRELKELHKEVTGIALGGIVRLYEKDVRSFNSLLLG